MIYIKTLVKSCPYSFLVGNLTLLKIEKVKSFNT